MTTSLPPLTRLPRAFGAGTGSSASSGGAGCLGPHLGRGFVFAQTLEGGLPHIAVAGPARELDLGDELRLDPVPVGLLARRALAAERALVGLERVELLEEPAGIARVEAGADPAGVDEVIAAVDADEQRAQVRSRCRSIRRSRPPGRRGTSPSSSVSVRPDW